MLGDDLVATRAVASGLARAQAARRRAFLAHLVPESESLDDDLPGLSDMVRYGVSLGRAARATPASPNLFTIEPGAEGVLSPDMLGSRRWFSLSEQVQRMGALLVLSAPASIPEIATLAKQVDGALTVGDALPPEGVRVLAQVHSGARMRTGNTPRATEPVQPTRSRGALRAAVLVAALAAPLAFPSVRARLGFGPDASQTPAESIDAPSSLTLPDIAPRVTSDAAWSAELRFINSRVDAAALVSSLVDSMPGPTFAPVRMTGEGSIWYRVLSGAFSDSLSAENFLAALRTRGVVPADGGAVTHTPFALLVDSAADNAMARVKVAGYQGRQLPAYALRDSTDRWRIYVGAFSEGRDADPLRMVLDSLNIQSTLVVRVGSTS